MTTTFPTQTYLAGPPTETGPPRPCSLALLLAQSDQGVDAAFAELYLATHARIYHVVLAVVRSPELAVEVTQETYLEVWQQCHRFDVDRGSVLGWMSTIARRRAVDRVRSVTRTLAREQRYTVLNAPVDADAWEDVAARLDATRVHRAVAALSPVQREALTLTYLGRCSAREAADVLDVPLSTVKTRIRNGLIRLRELLGGPVPEE